MLDFVRNIPGQVTGFFAGLGSRLIASGRALIQGFLDGIMQAFQTARNAVANGLQAIRRLFPFSPAKEGPFSGSGWVSYSVNPLVKLSPTPSPTALKQAAATSAGN